MPQLFILSNANRSEPNKRLNRNIPQNPESGQQKHQYPTKARVVPRVWQLIAASEYLNTVTKHGVANQRHRNKSQYITPRRSYDIQMKQRITHPARTAANAIKTCPFIKKARRHPTDFPRLMKVQKDGACRAEKNQHGKRSPWIPFKRVFRPHGLIIVIIRGGSHTANNTANNSQHNGNRAQNGSDNAEGFGIFRSVHSALIVAHRNQVIYLTGIYNSGDRQRPAQKNTNDRPRQIVADVRRRLLGLLRISRRRRHGRLRRNRVIGPVEDKPGVEGAPREAGAEPYYRAAGERPAAEEPGSPRELPEPEAVPQAAGLSTVACGCWGALVSAHKGAPQCSQTEFPLAVSLPH